jgi:hypothetical protein
MKKDLNKAAKPDSIDGLLRLIAWYYSSNDVTLDQVREFMVSIDIQDPDPDYVLELYRRYTDSVHDTGIAMAKKIIEQKQNS